MPLIVFDNELACSPGRLVHVLYKVYSVCLQRGRRGRGIVRFEVEMEVLAFIHELDRGVFLVYELEVKELTARSNARIKVFVLELEG
jgi:hypothetical protein